MAERAGSSRRWAVRAGALVVVSLFALAAVVHDAAGPAAGADRFPVFTPDEIVALIERTALPGTVAPAEAPPITYDGAADARIRSRAEATHYRRRPLSAVERSASAGVVLNVEAADALVRMRSAAGGAGAPFVAVSGYRSPDDQRSIFLRELAARGSARIGRPYTIAEIASGAADAAIDDVLQLNSIPGYSLHHTGDAVDLTAPGGSLAGFSSSAAYRWLAADDFANAKAFGFLPSYPDGATAIGPDPEPWELTYVGTRQIECARNVVALADTTPGRCPVGSLDSVRSSGTSVIVSGWAADPDLGAAPAQVHVYLDGRGAAVTTASGSRPDVDAATGLGPAHGFDVAIEASPGLHVVCAFAINDVASEVNTLLRCGLVLVTSSLPTGSIDVVRSSGNGVVVAGWAADPDVPSAALDVHAYVDGRGVAVLRAGEPRPDVDAVTGLGPAHGFSARVAVPSGVHQLCLYAISPQPVEGNPLLGCRLVWSLGSSPTGVLDRVDGDSRSISVQGWAVDGDVPDQPLAVHLYLDGVGAAVLIADGPRPDVGSAFSVGASHGFSARVPASVGPHVVCAYAIASQAGDGNSLLGCRAVTVAGRSPVGALDLVASALGGVSVAGWTADPDLPDDPLEVHVYVDGRGAAVLTADGARADVAAATSFGPSHGFSAPVPTPPGPHTVCAYAVSSERGESNTLLGCRAVVAG
jgi:hypothetical protein